MSKNSSTFKLDFRLALVVIIYLVSGIFLIGRYRYQINPDGISYISIAQKYLNGDFSDAVNGYWGPMFSWLLAPLLFVRIEPLLAAKILNLLIGVATIVGVRSLCYKFKMPESGRTVILLCAAPVVLSFGFSDITPDLVLMFLLLVYLGLIFQPNYAATIKYGVLCGFWGGLAYLTKSYAFPFFISHFFIMNIIHYFRGETKEVKRKVVFNFLTGAVVFAVISGVWIGLISNEYGYLTIGTSGKTTYGAAAAGGRGSLGIYTEGFVEPPNASSISIWEDPSYLKSSPYEPLDGWSFVKNQVRITAGHIRATGGVFMKFSVLSVAIGIAYVLFWLRRLNKAMIRTMPAEVLYPTVTIAIYAGGYSLVWVQARYLWVVCIMLMLMGGYVLGRLFENKFFTRARRAAILIILFLSFAVPASQELKAYANRGKRVYELSGVLKTRIGLGCNIASNTNWPGTLYLAYHLGCKYYGVPKRNISQTGLKSELGKYGIDYYFAWGGVAGDFRFLSNYQEITGGRVPGLRIYGSKKSIRP